MNSMQKGRDKAVLRRALPLLLSEQGQLCPVFTRILRPFEEKKKNTETISLFSIPIPFFNFFFLI